MNLFQRAIRHFERNGRFDWMPDKMYLKIIYLGALWKWPNLKDPQTYTEKLQWLKLYDRRPEYSRMVDKCDVKRYVAEKIGEEYIIPTLGVWDSFDEIDFDSLPNQFVLKCTHDSGGIVICEDKKKLDCGKAKKKIDTHMKRNYYLHGREWPYKNVKPRIIAEKFMEDDYQKDGLVDYKFYCFNGEPKFLYVSEGLHDHSTAKISYIDIDWSFSPFYRTDYKQFTELPSKPINYEKMLEFAKMLSKDISFLRVDMYEIGGKVYFSELTFFPGSGYAMFHPPEWEKEIGSWIILPKATNVVK